MVMIQRVLLQFVVLTLFLGVGSAWDCIPNALAVQSTKAQKPSASKPSSSAKTSKSAKSSSRSTKTKSSKTGRAVAGAAAGAAAGSVAAREANLSDSLNKSPVGADSEVNDAQLIWAFNLNAPLNLNMGVFTNLYGGEPKNRENVRKYQYLLKEWWNVTNRRELVANANNLTNSKPSDMHGVHNMMPLLEGRRGEISTTILASEIQTEIRDHQDILKVHGLRAWDLARVQTLVAWGYMADYLTIEEAKRMANLASDSARQQFPTAREWAESYLMGYLLWVRNMDKYEARRKVVDQLLQRPDGLWSDWR